MLGQAKKLARKNVEKFSQLLSADKPLVGIEPSAILGFRDEFPRLVQGKNSKHANELAKHTFLFEEFIHREVKKGNITSDSFTKEEKQIALHGHCHQKSLAGQDFSAFVLNLPENYTVSMIPSGCCGMAGAFGYEKEHFDLSMKVGELVLFPYLRDLPDDHIVVAQGTSCRHQIKDGVSKQAVHPAVLLYEALK